MHKWFSELQKNFKSNSWVVQGLRCFPCTWSIPIITLALHMVPWSQKWVPNNTWCDFKKIKILISKNTFCWTQVLIPLHVPSKLYDSFTLSSTMFHTIFVLFMPHLMLISMVFLYLFEVPFWGKLHTRQGAAKVYEHTCIVIFPFKLYSAVLISHHLLSALKTTYIQQVDNIWILMTYCN